VINMVLNWLTGGVADRLIDAYKAKLASGDEEGRIAADLAKRDLELRTQERIAQLGYPLAPANLFAYVTLIYYGKIVIWDVVLGLGSTDVLRGAASEWAGMIVLAIIGKSGVENVARILRR
jgi:hypothetical protein